MNEILESFLLEEYVGTVMSIYRVHILKSIAGSPIRRHFRPNVYTCQNDHLGPVSFP